MAVERCGVAYCDPHGVEHRVVVDAQSAFEAGVRALAVFRRHPWCARHLEPTRLLEITTQRRRVCARVQVSRLLRWLERSGPAPGEQRRKHHLKQLLLDVSTTERVNGRQKVH
jgi:hypothetical protein